jgi:hypothetical protein
MKSLDELDEHITLGDLYVGMRVEWTTRHLCATMKLYIKVHGESEYVAYSMDNGTIIGLSSIPGNVMVAWDRPEAYKPESIHAEHLRPIQPDPFSEACDDETLAY